MLFARRFLAFVRHQSKWFLLNFGSNSLIVCLIVYSPTTGKLSWLTEQDNSKSEIFGFFQNHFHCSAWLEIKRSLRLGLYWLINSANHVFFFLCRKLWGTIGLISAPCVLLPPRTWAAVSAVHMLLADTGSLGRLRDAGIHTPLHFYGSQRRQQAAGRALYPRRARRYPPPAQQRHAGGTGQRQAPEWPKVAQYSGVQK